LSEYPTDEFIPAKIIEQKSTRAKPRGGFGAPEYEEFDFDDEKLRNRESQGMEKQIIETAKSLEKKTLKKDNEVFYSIYTKAKLSEVDLLSILKGMKAEVVAYLDPKQNGVLVSGLSEKITRFLDSNEKVPKYLSEKVRVIKPLTDDEQIEDNFDKNENIQMAIFSIIPNLSKEKIEGYTNTLMDYLTQHSCPIYSQELKKYGFILSDVTLDFVKDIVNKATFIYKTSKIPDSVAYEIREAGKKSAIIDTAIDPENREEAVKNQNLPTVVMMDTGVNTIPQLDSIIKIRDSYMFQNHDDEYGTNGHGTPIANLIAYGEEGISPVANIISYKIHTDYERRHTYGGWMRAIEKYSSQSRLFVTSVGIPFLLSNQVVELEKIVQAKNICFICSAGNIEDEDIAECMKAASPYPNYIDFFPVIPPANGVNLVSVGGFAKKIHPTLKSIAKQNQISPHSRCGNGGFDLHGCKKPEVIEHGGNRNVDDSLNFNSDEVGVSTINNKGEKINSLSGTSFASPLFVRRLAEIEERYKDKIKNSETLLALTYVTCVNEFEKCGGYGVPTTKIGCNYDDAMYYGENSLRFNSVNDNTITIPYNDIVVYVPPDVYEIKICIIHSDDFKKSVRPTLHTYLDVKTSKLGNQGFIQPDQTIHTDEKTNTKIMTFRFDSKSMESFWTFRIQPKPAYDIMATDRRDITVRYGCAIMLNAKLDKKSKISLTTEINKKRKRYST